MSKMSLALEEATVHSGYLVQRLLHQGPNLYSMVKFAAISQELHRLERLLERPPRVLDLGCANRVALEYLRGYNCNLDYFGIDYEAALCPDVVADIRDAVTYRNVPWRPDVILLLDVLEHLEGGKKDILRVLKNCSKTVAPGGLILITVPQMYRLDRFKFEYLHYSEHKVRLSLCEWEELLRRDLTIVETRGVGYVSVLPYLVMFSKRYNDHGRLKELFNFLREHLFKWRLLRPMDVLLSKTLGQKEHLKKWANSCLIICKSG